MKQILAYSLMLFFIAALSAPAVSFAEDFDAHKGQVPATAADLNDRPQEGAGLIAPGVSCEACSADASATHMTNENRNAKKGSGSSTDPSKTAPQDQQQ